MAVVGTTRRPAFRRGLRLVLALALVLTFAAAALVWRPITVVNGLSRARLWVAGVRDGTTFAGAYRIHYLVAGSGRPVVLLHGFGGQGLQWGDYISVLARDARVYAPDLLGFGASDSAPDYSVPRQAEMLRAFLDSQNVQQADVVGVSMGGWIAASFATSYPARVRRLVLVDAAGLVFAPHAPTAFIPRDATDLSRLMRLVTPRKPPFPAFLAPGVVRDMRRREDTAAKFLEYRQSGKDYLDGRLGPITMPVLLVWGELDELCPLARAYQFHRQIPQSELVILRNCGHIAVMDCKSHAQPEIAAFLSTPNPPQGEVRTITVPW